jgi:sugar O-acyltransferase (sialic acid O-acetyltransferase NeuD family)
MKKVILAGYSGHAYIVAEILARSGYMPDRYLDKEKKKLNPFNLDYAGTEDDKELLERLKGAFCFVAVGDNQIRKRIMELTEKRLTMINAIDPSAIISSKIVMNGTGVMIGANAVVNALCVIGKGVICNTSSVLEHECKVDNFVHIGPGAILCGNVSVGSNSFIGAGAIIKEGFSIGMNVIVGAGSIILKNVEDNITIVGNPGRIV